MRFFLSVFCIVIFSGAAFAQRYAVIDGAWTGAIWAATPGGVAGSAPVPTATDDVFTNGRLLTVSAAGATCKNLFVTYNLANSISISALRSITITGTLSGYDDSVPGEEFPTAAVISYASTSVLIFTGANMDPAYDPYVIYFWDATVPIGRAHFNFGTGNTRSTILPLVFSGLLRVQSGTLAPDAGADMSGAGTATLTIEGALTTVDPLASFANAIISSTGILTTSNFFNTSGTLTLNGTLNTSYTGGTQGWWSSTNSPSSLSVSATSVVNFSANGSQNVPAQDFGNLTLSGSGTKTLVGSGSLNISGDLTISSAGVTFNSNTATAINIGRNLVNSGSWTPTDLVVFNGAAAQSFPGSALVTFNGGFEVNKSAGTLTLNRVISTAGFVVDPSNTLDLASYSVIMQGGDINNSGTIIPGTSTIFINGASTILGSSATSLNNLIINGPGTFTAPSGSLNISGNFTNNGTFVSGNGTIVFNAPTADQTIGGSSVTAFRNLTISNPIGWVNVESTQTLRGILTLSADAQFDADGTANNRTFTILSNADDPTQDGAIAAIPATATLDGNVTVQRYMSLEGNDGSGAGRIYRYISSPVTGATVSDLQAEIQVTGTFTGASVCSGCISTSQSMYRYNESVAGILDNGYEDFPAAINTETFAPGKGYALYVRGNLLTGPGNARYDLRGAITKGDQDLGVTFTSSGGAPNDGWNLVGNPYASTIDWDAPSGWTKTGVAGTTYIRNNVTNNYATYVTGSGGTNGGSRYIASGQAFWVQTTAASPSLLLTENVKAPGQVTNFFRESSPADLIRVKLASATASDDILIHFRADATDNFDANADARKLKNAIFNLSSLASDQSDLAINSMSALACGSEKSIQLHITDITSGNYSLNFSEFESFPDYVGIMLHDKFTKATINIRERTQYAFDITDENQNITTDRFTITFLPDAASLAAAPDHCIGTKSKPFIEIKNSKNGVRYVASVNGTDVSEQVNGNGGDIMMPIDASSLLAGRNEISLVSTIDACGFSTNQIVALTLNDQIGISGTESSVACREGSVELKAFGSPEAGSYNWYENESSVPLENHEPSITTPILTASQTYYVAVVSPEGCEGERVPVLANVVQFEDAAITVVGTNQLQSNHSEGNTWYFNGVKIPDATSSTYSPQNSGTYKLEVQVNGCSSSTEYEFVVLSSEQSLTSGISVYPNPVEDKAYIDVLENNEDIRGIVLYNSIGKTVTDVTWVKEVDKPSATVDMKNLPSGAYIVKISTSDRIVSLKIFKK